MTREVEPRIPRFPPEVVRYIAKKIADAYSNSEIEELFIDAGFKSEIIKTRTLSKTERVYKALSDIEESVWGEDHITKVLKKFVDPIRFENNEKSRIGAINGLNNALLRMKIQITKDCKIVGSDTLIKYENAEMLDNDTKQLDALLAKCRSKGLLLDENWVLSISALNVMEAAVNKKLDDLGGTTEGNFSERLVRIVNLVKERENRDIQKMLPESLYRGPRNKLDHASHTHAPTGKEAENIAKSVMDFIDELFPR